MKKKRSSSRSRTGSYGKSNSEAKFQPLSANVKVIGVGGGGSNAVSRMAKDFYRGVDFIAINTDHQDLDHCNVKHKLYIGRTLTRGLGAGMNPEIGRQAAEENRSEIAESIKDADLVFIAAGFGGGTGTGAAPVVAETAKQAGALTIAVVTKPFAFEGSQRERIAIEGLMKLRDKVDALIVVPNDRIFNVISKDTPIMKAFEAIDGVLRDALKGLVEIIAMPGIINVDFADVKNVMQDAGVAIVGMGIGTGADRAATAVNLALHSPLLETTAEGAKAVLLGISGSRDLKMSEVNDIAKLVADTADRDARIIFGAYHDRTMKPNQIKVTIVATGLNGTTTAANPLFGTNNFGAGSSAERGERSGTAEPRTMFTRATPTVGSGSVTATPNVTGPKKPLASSDMLLNKKEDGRDGSDFPTFGKSASSETTPKNIFETSLNKSLPTAQKDAKKEKDKEDDDMWDIPAFLRRRKK